MITFVFLQEGYGVFDNTCCYTCTHCTYNKLTIKKEHHIFIDKVFENQ